MFGRSKAITFQPYGRQRSRGRFPRWLLLLLSGMIIGVGGVLFVQERYMAPRLSPEASAQLDSALRQAEAARLRLVGELADVSKQLETAKIDRRTLADDLVASRATVERLRGDVASVVESLPSDPRSGIVQVRAARFTAKGGVLDYDVVLTRERATDKAMAGVMRLVVVGDSAQRTEASATLKPVALSMGSRDIVRGSLPLPEGFRPHRTTIQILDRADGSVLGMRVLMVRQ